VFTLLPALLSLAGQTACGRRRHAAAGPLARAAGRRLGRAAATVFLLLRRRAVAPAVVAVAALAGTGAALAGLPVHEMSHEPEPVLRFSLEFPSGVSADSVFQRSSPLEEALLRLPGVRGESASYERERARFSVNLRSWADRAAVAAWLPGAGAGVAEGFLYLPEGQSDHECFDVTVTGSPPASLGRVCGRLAEELRAWPGVSGVVLHYKEHQPAQVLVLAPQRCGAYGLLPRQIAARLFWALAFPVADKWTTGPIERDIRVGAAAARSGAAPALEEVLALRFATPTGAVVDARTLASIAEEPRPGRIYHLDRRRALSFSVVAERGTERRLLRAARGLLASYPFPPGISAVAGAAEAEQAQMLRAAAAGLALAVVLIFLIIMFHFESLRVSLAVMLQLPLSFLLPALLLRLLRIPLCTTTVMGLILTAGLVVNNAIIVLEGRNARSLRSRPLACALARHAPVVTAASLTTVLGALPLLFTPGAQAGGGVLGPLSLTLAAGVAGSLLTLPLGLALAARDPAGAGLRAARPPRGRAGRSCLRT
jgi:multidrug efflux pump subunit AcrB